MLISSCEIVNFRSIESVDFQFQENFQILVGLNESGKSNILRAVSLLGVDVDFNKDDIREPHLDSPPIEVSEVRFCLSLSDQEWSGFFSGLEERVDCIGLDEIIFVRDGKELSFKDLIKSSHSMQCVANVKSGTRGVSGIGFDLLANLRTSLAVLSGDGAGKIEWEDEEYDAVSGIIYPASCLLDVESGNWEDVDVTYLESLVDELLSNYIDNNLPQVVFWKYSDSELLPPRVPIDSFVQDPESCGPLAVMFNLAGISDPANAILEAKKHSKGLKNLLRRVSAQSTAHIRAAWPELPELSVSLTINGAHIDASIQDVHNEYDMAKRSDGFKRFVTFLIMVSARLKYGEASSCVIIIDEPDVGLHPSGVSFLRDELISLSSNHTVLISTHSTEMIDRDCVGRHLIVKKDEETTSVKRARGENYRDEEVLYNALGSSLFESLKQKNIVFEGRRDRLLFEAALSGLPDEMSEIKGRLEDVGACHAQGVKDVKNIYPLLELANRKYLVVSDADKPARQQQEMYDGNGKWVRYDELGGKVAWETAEDFIDINFIQEAVGDVVLNKGMVLDLDALELVQEPGVLSKIEAWFVKSNGGQEGKREFMNQVKEYVFSNLLAEHIVSEYVEILKNIDSGLSAM